MPQYRVSDLLVDVARARVTRAGSEVPLPKLSFDLLLALVESAPAVVTPDELMTRVWPGLVVGPETVSKRVTLLREALADDPRQPRYIAVVRGRGVRLMPEVERLDPNPAPISALEGGSADLLLAPAQASRRRVPLGRRVAIIAAFAMLAAVLLFFAVRRGAPGPSSSATTNSAVAVLPFVNLTGDASKDYLGDGMAEELINTLTRVPGLKVPARTSSFAYKGRSTDIRQIARELGVAYIIEGSVRTADERIRITAQLISAQDGLHVWSEGYDRRFSDLFKLQDDLATAIVTALQPALGARSATTPVLTLTQGPASTNVAAYNLFLQGASLSRRQNLARAIGYFQQALTLDPKFARAQQGIADALFVSGWIYGRQVSENITAGERAARLALVLDPGLADAHNVLAGVAAARGRWLEMEAHDREAAALGQSDAQVRLVRADHLAVVGRLQAAFDEAQAAYTLAPADPQVVIKLAAAHSILGRDAEALQLVQKAVDLGLPEAGTSDTDASRRRASFHAGRFAEAQELEMKTLDTSDPEQARTAEVLKLVYGALTHPEQKPAAITARARLYGRSTPPPRADRNDITACMHSSMAYALLGALDVAYDLADQCLDSAVPDAVLATAYVNTFKWDPDLRSFRRDRRFQAFATRLGLMEYWQRYGLPDDCDLTDGKLTCH